MKEYLDLIFGVVLVLFAMGAYRSGKIYLSFATYDRKDNPLMFQIYFLMALIGGVILIINEFFPFFKNVS